ncbi:MAG: hypothetical protein ACYC61_30655 [Isosphaeraceae bacterium]
MTIQREMLRMACAMILATAVGCSTGTSTAPDDEAGSRTGTLPVQTKELPKGARVGKGQTVVH